jgi:hypothetical protein
MKIIEFDVVYLSYDEPNADLHYADLCNKVPWAKRVHGIKGSDHAHKAAAETSETDWFITVDADNIVDAKFFNIDLDMSDPKIKVYGWCGRNVINGLRYGNGGLKIWNKEFVLNMKTHENSDTERGQVDFCWEDGYRNFPLAFSDSIITGSPFQAWRAGFREGVKMTLLDGVKVPPQEIQQRIWWHNIHRLRMWSTVGSHEENGKYAVLGARMGTYMTNCTEWDYVQVRDFEVLREIYETQVKDSFSVEQDALDYAFKIRHQLGLDWPWLNEQQSKYTLDLYNETMNLNDTYFRMPVPTDV